MEFLKEVFGDGSLTYAELEEKLKGNDKIKLANLASGLYVDKGKLAGVEAELAAAKQSNADLQEAVKKFDGVDVAALNKQIKDLQEKYDKDVADLHLSAALDMALVNAKAHDVKAVKPFLDMDIIKMDGDNIVGLDEQLKKLQEEKSFLFNVKQQDDDSGNSSTGSAFVNTGGNHGGDLGGGMDALIGGFRRGANLPTEK